MPPTSSLSSSARRALRAAAHHLEPVVMIGQHGLTPAVLHEIDLALTAHALIKVRVQSDERETREAFLAEICQKMACESVQHLGKLLVLWRNAGDGGDDDVVAGQEAVSVKAASGRGPRSKLPRPASSAVAARGQRTPVPRGADQGRGSRNDNATGERRRYGEPLPPPPRREGWAPKNRRGAARFGSDDGAGSGSSGYGRRRDAGEGFDAPRGRAPAGGGRGAPRDEFSAPPRGRTGGAGGAGYGRSGAGEATGNRWGERRNFDDRSGDRGRSRTGAEGGGFAGDTGTGRRPPSSRQGGDGWSNRDGFSGKPRGFAPRGGAGGRGSTSAAPAAKPRARRRLG